MRRLFAAIGRGWGGVAVLSAATSFGQAPVGYYGYPVTPGVAGAAAAPAGVPAMAARQPEVVAPGYGYAAPPAPETYVPAAPAEGMPSYQGPLTAPPCYSGVPSYVGQGGSPCDPPPSACIEACAPAMCCTGPAWTVRAGALFLFQDNENHQTFSYDSAIETNQYLDSKDLDPDLLPGVEIGVSRFDCCTMTGWEGLYWGLFPEDSTASVYNTDVTGSLDPILDFSQLDYNGSPANNFTNAAVAHRLRRSSEFHNAELNRLWGVPGSGYSAWQIRTLAGFRYFRFEEGLEFATDTTDGVFTGAADELYYTIDTENNLYGLQLGALVERQAWGRLGVTAGVKAGVFGNDAQAHSRIGGAAGTATVNNGPNNGRAWDIVAEKQDVAFLAEVQAGLTYQLGARWRAIAQYRVMGVSGVALPNNQIYHDLRGLQDVELLNTNGSLFLHGAFVGAERVF